MIARYVNLNYFECVLPGEVEGNVVELWMEPDVQ